MQFWPRPCKICQCYVNSARKGATLTARNCLALTNFGGKSVRSGERQLPLVPALFLVCIASLVSAEEDERALYLGSYSWTMDKPWFGGWSGIELSPDGLRMTAITDRGRLLKADIKREGGQIAKVIPGRMWRLKASTGNRLTSRIADSEGLAIAADGTINISFEGVTRVARYTRPSAAAQVLRHHKAFRNFARNKSLEALAVDRNGRFYAIAERLEDDRTITVYVLDKGGWTTPFSLTGKQGFLPVGADFGPEGRFYLLERDWSVPGFRSRVRRWDMTNGQPENETVLIQTPYGTHDNLEGLAVWRDEQDRTRLTMIADDNFLSFQRTEIVEYAVQE